MTIDHDPITVAESLRWARQFNDDGYHSDLMRRAAETLNRCVPSYWHWIATIEAAILLLLALTGRIT